MATFAKGDVVTLPFPLSTGLDAFGKASKIRPAVVLAHLQFGKGKIKTSDYILCAITSQNAPDPNIISLGLSDVTGGSLDRSSFIRPTYLFTAHEGQIGTKIGKLIPVKVSEVVNIIIGVLS